MVSSAAELSRMTEEELDALPYGAIRLSPRGTILGYNATEGRIAGRKPERVLGRNFFLDVAPCTDVREFRGRFLEMVRGEGSLLQEFTFEFAFDPPITVAITFLKDRSDGSVWVLVEPLPAGR